MSEQKTIPLSLETANKIADALDCPTMTQRLEIVLDWQSKQFFVLEKRLVTDEQGRLVAEALKFDGRGLTFGDH